MICLTSVLDLSDLLRLAAIVKKQKDASDPPGYDSAHQCRGEHAEELRGPLRNPTCGDILASSKQAFIRTAATEWLVEMNDSRMGVVPRPCSGASLRIRPQGAFREVQQKGGLKTMDETVASDSFIPSISTTLIIQ